MFSDFLLSFSLQVQCEDTISNKLVLAHDSTRQYRRALTHIHTHTTENVTVSHVSLSLPVSLSVWWTTALAG